jgi:hypothetical protein
MELQQFLELLLEATVVMLKLTIQIVEDIL